MLYKIFFLFFAASVGAAHGFNGVELGQQVYFKSEVSIKNFSQKFNNGEKVSFSMPFGKACNIELLGFNDWDSDGETFLIPRGTLLSVTDNSSYKITLTGRTADGISVQVSLKCDVPTLNSLLYNVGTQRIQLLDRNHFDIEQYSEETERLKISKLKAAEEANTHAVMQAQNFHPIMGYMDGESKFEFFFVNSSVKNLLGKIRGLTEQANQMNQKYYKEVQATNFAVAKSLKQKQINLIKEIRGYEGLLEELRSSKYPRVPVPQLEQVIAIPVEALPNLNSGISAQSFRA